MTCLPAAVTTHRARTRPTRQMRVWSGGLRRTRRDRSMPNEDHFDTATREQLVTAIKHPGSHLISEACVCFPSANLCANTNQSARIKLFTRGLLVSHALITPRSKINVEVEAKSRARKSRDVLLDNWRRSCRDQMAPGARALTRGTGANRSFSSNELFIAPQLPARVYFGSGMCKYATGPQFTFICLLSVDIDLILPF